MCISRIWVGGVSPEFPELLRLQPEAVYEIAHLFLFKLQLVPPPRVPPGMERKENEKKAKRIGTPGRTTPHRSQATGAIGFLVLPPPPPALLPRRRCLSPPLLRLISIPLGV
jgi:hypothetical protein